MESVLEKMEREHSREKMASFVAKQKLPYNIKVQYAERRAKEFVEECERRGLNYHVSVGGLDSITLGKTSCSWPLTCKCLFRPYTERLKGGADGKLYTTKAQRTGCSMCGFGIHMEKRPHRFDLLYERNLKEWDYWMNHVCKDENGNEYGWGKVLDYIGVEWRQPE